MHIKSIKLFIKCTIINVVYLFYSIYKYFKIKAVRKKDKISVLFVVIDVGQWKTECLYCYLLNHLRFTSMLGITTSTESPHEKDRLVKYAEGKGYEFIDLDNDKSINEINPDIIIYQKPYDYNYPKKHRFLFHLKSLFCYVNYGFHTIEEDWTYNEPLYKFLWMNFYENQSTFESIKTRAKRSFTNIVVTGLPFSESLAKEKNLYPDPWKKHEIAKKRIIYAPHHTVSDHEASGIDYATFLENGEFILNLAKKLKNTTQWAFKPHPFLYVKLVKIWGEEKTKKYYNEWATLDNTQLVEGSYIDLFKHSDAMVHDSCSFTVEYHYTGNPVCYLTNDFDHKSNINDFAKEAFDLHYKAKSHQEIEKFVENVLLNVDPLKEKRKDFYNRMLMPPNGKSPSENIANEILGADLK